MTATRGDFRETWEMRKAENESPQLPDRGEDAEVLSIIEELGAETVLRVMRAHDLVEIDAAARRASLGTIRVALANIIEPRKGATSDYEALIVAYAINYPGLPSMRDTATGYGWTVAKVSKDVKEFQERQGLPRSRYQKALEAVDTYAVCNRRRHKK